MEEHSIVSAICCLKTVKPLTRLLSSEEYVEQLCSTLSQAPYMAPLAYLICELLLDWKLLEEGWAASSGLRKGILNIIRVAKRQGIRICDRISSCLLRKGDSSEGNDIFSLIAENLLTCVPSASQLLVHMNAIEKHCAEITGALTEAMKSISTNHTLESKALMQSSNLSLLSTKAAKDSCIVSSILSILNSELNLLPLSESLAYVM